MKKWIIIGIAIVAMAALTVSGFVWAGKAYAQSQEPPYPPYPYGGMMGGGYGGYGMMGRGYGGYGMMGGYGTWGVDGYGPMHEYMIDALAGALNLTPEQLQNRLNQGETVWQIAQAQGLSADQFQQAMEGAHDKALDEAVQSGLLTQQQADWMDQHMESMWSGGYGCFGDYPDSDGANTPNSSTNNAPNGMPNPNPGDFHGMMMGNF